MHLPASPAPGSLNRHTPPSKTNAKRHACAVGRGTALGAAATAGGSGHRARPRRLLERGEDLTDTSEAGLGQEEGHSGTEQLRPSSKTGKYQWPWLAGDAEELF